MYPPIPFLNRKCNKDYVIPGTDVKIEKGMSSMINVMGMQRDPEYFPDPDKFNPDRFSKENKHNIRPFTFLPFGDGPRVCIGTNSFAEDQMLLIVSLIGQRFAILQNKIGLVMILKHFRIFPGKDTPKSIILNPKSIVTVPTKTIMLKSQLL